MLNYNDFQIRQHGCFSVQANKQQIKINGGGLDAMENVCLMFLLNPRRHELIDYVNQYTLNQKPRKQASFPVEILDLSSKQSLGS